MIIIYKNDQYFLKVRPTINEIPIDETCDEMIIKLGNVIKKKSLNEISYDNELKCWLFPLEIDQSSKLNYSVNIQVWFSFDDNYYSTPVKKIIVGTSIIEKSEVV